MTTKTNSATDESLRFPTLILDAMKQEIWNAITQGFEKHPVTRSPTRPSAEQVAAAEQALKVQFADDYRDFILRYGAGIVGSQSVIGIGRAEAMGKQEASVSDATFFFRKEAWIGVNDWYVISIDGSGNPIGVDRNGEVHTSDHDARKVVRLCGSFEEWIERICLKRKQ
ncbi:MAG: SMI1/KNR4 family protein [Planctomycetes bacterium]|nr:SMI1/KNR4 family protein [Planctomycetota bacterium]